MSNESKNIVFAYFSGHASLLHKKWLEEWLSEENNRELFYVWLEEWETSYPQFVPDMESALQRYLVRLTDESADGYKLSK